MADKRERPAFDRRRDQTYFVFTEDQIENLVARAALAGARAAVDELLALLSRKTIRNLAILLVACLGVFTSWLTGWIHLTIGKTP